MDGSIIIFLLILAVAAGGIYYQSRTEQEDTKKEDVRTESGSSKKILLTIPEAALRNHDDEENEVLSAIIKIRTIKNDKAKNGKTGTPIDLASAENLELLKAVIATENELAKIQGRNEDFLYITGVGQEIDSEILREVLDFYESPEGAFSGVKLNTINPTSVFKKRNAHV